MRSFLREWAGTERRFALPLGCIFDLEEACGQVGIGEIFLRITRQVYFARDIYHTIKQGLIGGGLDPAEAKRLLDERFDAQPLSAHLAIAFEILMTRVDGMEVKSSGETTGPPQPLNKGKILQSLIAVGLSPEQVRAMRYDDFVALCEAAGSDADDAPSEEEYEAMLEAWAARAPAVETADRD